jgi:hypothetical protein
MERVTGARPTAQAVIGRSAFLMLAWLTVAEGAHVPWIEAPNVVFNALQTFLAGAWPQDAEQLST